MYGYSVVVVVAVVAVVVDAVWVVLALVVVGQKRALLFGLGNSLIYLVSRMLLISCGLSLVQLTSSKRKSGEESGPGIVRKRDSIPSATTPLNLAIHSLPPSAGLLNVTLTCNPSPDFPPLLLIRCTSLTPPPIFPNVALISSTDTVGAKFDIMTLELAVPAMDIDEDDNCGDDNDFVSATDAGEAINDCGGFRGD